MKSLEQTVIILYCVVHVFVFIKGFYETRFKKNAFGTTPLLSLLGIFVWGDTIIFGPFWVITSIIILLLQDWYLFTLILSVFWVVRSLGETIYWLNEQFSKVNRNPPEKLLGHSLFHNDSVWFAYQIFWQCITVISIIFTMYCAKIWLR